MGQTHDVIEAQKLAALSMDLARAKNIDLATATDAITKAYNGQARALAAVGIDVAGAAGRTQLLARAYDNVNGAAKRYAATGAGAVAKANASGVFPKIPVGPVPVSPGQVPAKPAVLPGVKPAEDDDTTLYIGLAVGALALGAVGYLAYKHAA